MVTKIRSSYNKINYCKIIETGTEQKMWKCISKFVSPPQKNLLLDLAPITNFCIPNSDMSSKIPSVIDSFSMHIFSEGTCKKKLNLYSSLHTYDNSICTWYYYDMGNKLVLLQTGKKEIVPV